jgi:hypothetical protein
MKLLLFSDLFLDSTAARETFRLIVRRAREHGVALICSAGNLIDNDSTSADDIAFLNSELDPLLRDPQRPIDFLIAPGPADALSDASPYDGLFRHPRLHLFNDNQFWRLELQDVTTGVVTIWGAAHTDRGAPQPHEPTVGEDGDGAVHLSIYYHQPVIDHDENFATPRRPEAFVLGVRHAMVGGLAPDHTPTYTSPGPAASGFELLEIDSAGAVRRTRLAPAVSPTASVSPNYPGELEWITRILSATSPVPIPEGAQRGVFRTFVEDVNRYVDRDLAPGVIQAAVMAMQATIDQPGVRDVG